METSGTDMLSDSESQAPVSPLHLAVSLMICLYEFFIWLLISQAPDFTVFTITWYLDQIRV